MKKSRKFLSLLAVMCVSVLAFCTISGCGLFGAKEPEKTEFQKYFDDYGTNFIFEGSNADYGYDCIILEVTEEGMFLDMCGNLQPDENDSSIRYGHMYYKKTDNGYTQYKSVYRNQIATGTYVTKQVTNKQYQNAIDNVVDFLLLPIANYEKSFEVQVVDIPEEDLHQKLYTADKITHSLTIDGESWTWEYMDVWVNVINGKLYSVSYHLKQTNSQGQSVTEIYELIVGDAGPIEFPNV